MKITKRCRRHRARQMKILCFFPAPACPRSAQTFLFLCCAIHVENCHHPLGDTTLSCVPSQMTDLLLEEIARSTGSPADQLVVVVDSGRLAVAYADGITAFMRQCAAFALTSRGLASDAERGEFFEELFGPTQLSSTQTMDVDAVGGAELALMMCALGENPFLVAKPADNLALDAVEWKRDVAKPALERAARRIFAGRMQITTPESAASAPTIRLDAVVANTENSIPREVLRTLVLFVTDNPTPEPWLRALFARFTAPPPWITNAKDATELRPSGVYRLAVPGASSYEQYDVAFSSRTGMCALLRALLAALYAMEHARAPATQRALPQPLRWAVHVPPAGVARFYVLCQTPKGAKHGAASGVVAVPAVTELLVAAADQLRLFTPTVRPDDVLLVESNTCALRLSAMFGAFWPDLPTAGTKQVCYTAVPRLRALYASGTAAASAEQWYNGVPFDQPPSDLFTRSQPATHVDLIDASLQRRITSNPYCRTCGARLSGQRALVCATHTQTDYDAKMWHQE